MAAVVRYLLIDRAPLAAQLLRPIFPATLLRPRMNLP